MDNNGLKIINCEEEWSHVMRDDREQLNYEREYNREMRYFREKHNNERESIMKYIHIHV